MKFSYQTGFFICIILVVLLIFKDIYKYSFQFTLEKNARGSDANLDISEDLFYSLIYRNSSLNSTMMDKVISRLFTSPHSTLSSMNETDIENILDQNVNITNSNKNWTISFLVSKIRRHQQFVRKCVSKNFTLVTAYWDLGTFRKGSAGLFSTSLYKNLALSFRYMLNPFVIYTDSLEFKNLMETIRKNLSFCTKIIYMNRTNIGAFKLVDKIKKIYEQPNYPKYYPNTVNPAYAAAQNAKYNVMAETYRHGLFNTTYYGWIDVGYFRDLVDAKDFYVMVVPPDFDPTRLAFNRVNPHVETTDPLTVFRDNMVWVGEGMVIGKGNVIEEYERFYQRAVDFFLDLKLMNTDQQVIYSVYTKKGRQSLKPEIEIQPYLPKPPGNAWFYLGFLCRKVIKIP
ncbi:uncharacterized protein LOC111115530 [Crassostrea virginica]